MADIFVSYKREDRDRVEPLARELEREGFSVWWDPELQIGQSYAASIRAELNQARAVIPVWTSLSVQSEWVQEEATHGKRRGVLVPVRLDAVDPPIGFTMVETADLTGWHEGDPGHEEWSRLLQQLHATLRHPAVAPEPARVAPATARRAGRTAVASRTPLIAAVSAMVLAVVVGVFLFRDGPDVAGPNESAATVGGPVPTTAGTTLPREVAAPVVAAGVNSTMVDARPLGLGIAEPGELLTTEDTRYYVVGNALKVRDLVLVRLENASSTLRPDVKIFNAEKSLITEAYDGSAGASVQHVLPLTPGQPIYLQVLPYGTAGKYRISVTPQQAFDAFEPNDDLLSPRAVKVATDISAGIMDDKDPDFYRFSGATGTTIKVAFENLSTTLRPNLKVYDRNKSQLVEKYDPTPGANMNFDVDIKQAGDFFLEVAPYGTAGKYRLRID